MSRPHLSRRQTLTGVATVGIGLPLLSACGSSNDAAKDAPGADASTGDTPSGSSSSAGGGSKTPSESASSSAPPSGLVAASDVPVGGGVILADQRIVITQPTQGEFKGFSAVCTHQGCLVSSVTSTINCTCHGSAFDIATGAVAGGPAPSPLPAVAVKDVQGEVVQG